MDKLTRYLREKHNDKRCLCPKCESMADKISVGEIPDEIHNYLFHNHVIEFLAYRCEHCKEADIVPTKWY